MSNKTDIEEDIKIVERLVTTKFNNDYSIDNVDKEAIENILAERESLKKENKELTRDNFKLNAELENKRKEYQETYKDVKEELKELQAKANRYDNLVEKIKEEIADLEVPILIYGGRGNGRTYARAEKEAKKYILKYILELLNIEEE